MDRINNPEKHKERRIESYQKGKIRESAYMKKYREEHKEHISEWKKEHYLNNREEILKKQKEYKEKNKDIIRERHSVRHKYRMENDTQYRMKILLRGRMYKALHSKNASKHIHSMDLIGCPVSEVISHLENQFTEGMSWENHNIYGFHIDHIIPCDFFDLNNELEQLICFNWRNLQPLWAEDNLAKGSILPDNLEELYTDIKANVLLEHPDLEEIE